jgi:hypothetical protein
MKDRLRAVFFWRWPGGAGMPCPMRNASEDDGRRGRRKASVFNKKGRRH